MRFILKFKKTSRILCLFWFFFALSKGDNSVRENDEQKKIPSSTSLKNNNLSTYIGKLSNNIYKRQNAQPPKDKTESQKDPDKLKTNYDGGGVDDGQNKEHISNDLDDEENPLNKISTDLFEEDPKSKIGTSDFDKSKTDHNYGGVDNGKNKQHISDNLDDEENPLNNISTDLFEEDPKSETETSDLNKSKPDHNDGGVDNSQNKQQISNNLDDEENPLNNISSDLFEEDPKSQTGTSRTSDLDELKTDQNDGGVDNGKNKEQISDDLYEKKNPSSKIPTDLIENDPESGTGNSDNPIKPIIEKQDSKKQTLDERDDNEKGNKKTIEDDNAKNLVDIVQDGKNENNSLKSNTNHDEYLKEKEQRKVTFEVEKPIEARFFCTIWDKLPYMYKMIKKRFVGDLCHAIVLGTPLNINRSKVVIPKDKSKQLKDIYYQKTNETLLMVIMKHSSYEAWSNALQNIKKEVNILIKFIKNYKIDGIQFSNLQPTALEQWDAEMLCKILKFFKLLLKKTKSEKIPNFKIGITISAYSQSISTSFQSFKDLNKFVYWYSINTISMIKCTPAYLTGTSPLDGEISLKTSLRTLIDNTNIEKTKIVVSIQLYPNKLNTYQHSTYIEMCQSNRKTWRKWCAARPEHFRLKGQYLRNLHIWGIQLYYMDSDDYKSRCKCFSFPMIRALLRGLINMPEPEYCPFLGEVENQPAACALPEK